MACPYFEPAKPRSDVNGLIPLGDFWSGMCRASGAAFEPDERVLSECCNMGYARGRCPQFPDGPGADAVRFTITSDSANVIRVGFSLEKDHLPHGRGTLEYSRSSRIFTESHPDRLIQQQARAYLASYLRRKPAVA